METIKNVFLVISYSIISVSAGISFAQEKTTTQLQAELVSSWIATVEGDTRPRTLKIRNVLQKSEEIFSLDAAFGYSDMKPQAPANADIIQTAKERKLILTAKSGAKIVATQGVDGSFVGTFTYNDEAKGVKITKVSDADLQALLASTQAASFIKPSDRVPASCAGFFGGWTGIWSGFGQTWLWVTEIDANCVATYAHRTGSRIPAANIFKKAEIVKGVLSFPDYRGDTDVFELHGDELWARHQGTSGTNSTVFRKVQTETR